MKQLLAAAFLLLALQAAAAGPAGFQSVTIPAEHHGRKMSGALWYPSGDSGEAISYGENAVFFGTPVLDGARMAQGPFPVILASHGLGGNIGALGWLTAGLAEAGALVISVNHPNSTTRDFNLQEGLKHWTRTQDLRAALDWLAAQPDLAAQADFSRVYAVGFSAGRLVGALPGRGCAPTSRDTPPIARPRPLALAMRRPRPARGRPDDLFARGMGCQPQGRSHPGRSRHRPRADLRARK